MRIDRGTERRRYGWLSLDVGAVLLFVALGRDTHDEGGGVGELLETAAPFLVGLAVGWIVTAAWREPLALRTGLGVAAATIVVGMLVRRLGFGDGTAASFVVVATIFLTVFELGWRLVVGRVTDAPAVRVDRS